MSGAGAGEHPLRLFVALNLEAELRAAVHRALAAARQDVPPRVVAWVPEANLHLTVRFLGEQPPDRVRALREGLVAVAAGAAAIALRIGGLGAFPSWRCPSVVWIGAQMNVALAALYQKVDDLCESLGAGREPRAFHPHVTVGRVRRGERLPPEAVERLAGHPDLPTWTTTVTSVDLMSSELAPGGARYRVLQAAALDGRGT